MNTKEVLDCLSNEFDLLNNLKNVILEKQKALICSDVNGIDIYTRQEENLLTELKKEETKRLRLINEIIEQFKFLEETRQEPKLSSLLKGKVVKNDLEKISTIESKIKTAVLDIKEINKQNQMLIQNSLEFINETILTLLGSRKRTFVDKKV